MKKPIFAISILLVCATAVAAAAAPTYEEVRAAYRPSDALLLDRNGEVLHELRTDMHRRRLGWTGIEEVSPALPQAVLQAEDRRFYAHGGVDFRAAGAALVRAATGGGLRGASTITMQVAALLDPALKPGGGRRSLGEKWRQMRAAWELERRWSKARILEAYLNLVYFRGEFQGVGAAARGIFAKAPHGLDQAESAVLAVLIRAPNAGREAVAVRAAVLARALTPAAGPDEIARRVAQVFESGHRLPPRAELAPQVARQVLKNGGEAVVRSTLVAELQQFAAERLNHHLQVLRSQHMGEGALLAVDNASGDILAYLSATSDPARGRFVDGVTAKRQAGSTLKPFLYAAAFDRRILTPASLLDDSPLDIGLSGGIYQPKNYDGGHRGAVSARNALASSMNVPAVRVLELVGTESFLSPLRGLGVRGLTEAGDFYGPSLALGTADVTLRELVAAYRALANDGVYTDLQLLPADGAPGGGRRVFSAAAAFLAGDILADRQARSFTFGLENPLATRFWTAVKTGTSKDMRDNWCVGYSRRYTVGVWVGNFSGAPMRDVSGLTGAAPLWLELMNRLHAREGSAAPDPPADVVRAAPPPAGEGRREWFLRGTEPPPGGAPGGPAPVRIAYPPEGAVLAVDPDIPHAHQQVLLAASARREGLAWVLDGRRLAFAGKATAWKPSPGRHHLALYDGGGNLLDAVRFEVKGSRP